MARGIDGYLKRGRTIERRYGWMIQGVLADESQPSYSYSVGLSKTFGHPEIFMIGFHPDVARSVIDVAGNKVKAGARLEAPAYVDEIIESHPVAIVPLDPGSVYEHSSAGRAILGRSFDGVLLLLPDAAGRFPWDEGCDPTYATGQTSFLKIVGDRPARQ
jgi:Domain of unknown function (DUF4262)